MNNKEKIDRLIDAVIEEFLTMSSEEVMEHTTPEDIDAVNASVTSATAKVGRARLARAKSAAAMDARRPRPVGSASGADALREARANDAAFDKKLTLAARKASAGYEADQTGIEEDLDELRRWEEDGDPA
jgi:hypothetical protein